MTNEQIAAELHDHVALIFARLEEMAQHMTREAVPPTVQACISLTTIRRLADKVGVAK